MRAADKHHWQRAKSKCALPGAQEKRPRFPRPSFCDAPRPIRERWLVDLPSNLRGQPRERSIYIL